MIGGAPDGSQVTRQTSSRAATAFVVALSIVLSGCALNGLAFVTDDRISFRTPKESSKVKLPFTIAWDAEEYEGSYAVFLDHSPMRPGEDLLSLVPDDDPCRDKPVCPDTEWLNERYIFLTDERRLEIAQLRDRRSSSRASDRHQVTIVLIDGSGKRSGESAFIREFIVDRPD